MLAESGPSDGAAPEQMEGRAEAQAPFSFEAFAFPYAEKRAESQTPCAEKKPAEEEVTPPPVKKTKLRQAEETVHEGGHVEVEVLCSQCRRDSQSKRQMSLGEMLARPAPSARPAAASEAVPTVQAEVDLTGAPPVADPTICRRCRRSLVVEHMSIGKSGAKTKAATGCAFSARLKQYKRQAATTNAEWRLTDSEGLALMREPCALCGAEADPEAGRPNGITRLREVSSDIRGMGPYAVGNVSTACSTCNSLKGTHTLVEVAEICRTIVTHRGLGDFGRFPDRFVDNVSRKSRSCYLGDTARKPGGTVASKTHSLSNQEFASIVARPCHYCGKENDPPRHHNGLDRLDNSLRVYTAANAVSCCGTCNMAKGRLSEDLFLRQCRAIATQAAAAGTADCRGA